MFKDGKHEIRKKEPEGGFSLLIAGDCCPRDDGQTEIMAGRTADIIVPIMPYLEGVDIRIMQWETPLTTNGRPIPKSGPNLNCVPASVELALQFGTDVALLANNHIGDQGPDAVLETIKHFEDAGIKTVGAGKNLTEAERPLLLEKNHLKLAILNFAEHEFGIAEGGKPGCAPLAPLRNIKAIQYAATIADIVIVTMHGGHEYYPFPSPRMIENCRAFAEAGASVVFNCHPHCPQGIEIWNGTPIIYSPGNFYFPIGNLREDAVMWRVGFVPIFRFDRRGCYQLEIFPYHFSNQQILPITGKAEEIFFNYLKNLSQPLTDQSLIAGYFDGWSSYTGPKLVQALLDTAHEKWPPTTPDPHWMLCRNLFSCESHVDVIRNFWLLVEECRLAEAESLLPEIKQYQNCQFLQKEVSHEEIN